MKKIFLLILFFVLFASALMAQGQIYKKADAEVQFGEIVQKHTIDVSLLKNIIAGKEKIGFNINNNLLLIADENRNVLYGTLFFGKKINDSELLFYFGVDMVQKLLSLSNEETVTFTIRAGKRVVKGETFNYYCIETTQWVLQLSNPCPPDCLLIFPIDYMFFSAHAGILSKRIFS